MGLGGVSVAVFVNEAGAFDVAQYLVGNGLGGLGDVEGTDGVAPEFDFAADLLVGVVELDGHHVHADAAEDLAGVAVDENGAALGGDVAWVAIGIAAGNETNSGGGGGGVGGSVADGFACGQRAFGKDAAAQAHDGFELWAGVGKGFDAV